MGNLSTAILGALAGGGDAVAKIGEDKRKDLAQKLRDERIAQMDMTKQKDQQEFTSSENDKKLAAEGEKSQTKLNADWNDSEANRQMQIKLQKMRDAVEREKMNAPKGSETEKGLSAKITAMDKAFEDFEANKDMDVLNYRLSAIGMPVVETYTKKPAEPSILGFGGSEAEMGLRAKPDASTDILPTATPNGPMPGSSPQNGPKSVGVDWKSVPSAKGVQQTQPASQVMPQAGQQTPQAQQPAQLPKDMSQWDVTITKIQGKQQPVVITQSGPIPISEEQYAAWQKWQQEQGSTIGNVLKSAKTVSTSPRTMPKMW